MGYFFLKMVDHIDASILCEIFVEKSERAVKEDCEAYLYKIVPGKHKITIPALGEVFTTIIDEPFDWQKRSLTIEKVKDIVDKVDLYFPKKKAFKIAIVLDNKFYGFDFADLLHVASAIEDCADRFITIDNALLSNMKFLEFIKLKSGLRIARP